MFQLAASETEISYINVKKKWTLFLPTCAMVNSVSYSFYEDMENFHVDSSAKRIVRVAVNFGS